MKNILPGILLLTNLCCFAKGKNEEKEPAFKKGDITAGAAYGTQKLFGISGFQSSHNISAFGEYQLSRKFNVGVQYSFYSYHTILFRSNYQVNGRVPLNGPIYQTESWYKNNVILVTGEYCFVNKGKVSIGAGLGVGVVLANGREHTIDSSGISTNRTLPFNSYLAVQLQFVNAKVRVSENFGVYGGVGLGYRGLLSLGACYTFTERK